MLADFEGTTACYTNVIDLINAFRSNGVRFDIERAKILYLYQPKKRIHPLLLNPDANDGWYFHVVVFYRGRIYDRDFSGRPAVPRIGAYFQRMFPEKRFLRVREIAASDYLRDYDQIKGVTYFGYRFYWGGEEQGVEAIYPSVSLRTYLASER